MRNNTTSSSSSSSSSACVVACRRARDPMPLAPARQALLQNTLTTRSSHRGRPGTKSSSSSSSSPSRHSRRARETSSSSPQYNSGVVVVVVSTRLQSREAQSVRRKAAENSPARTRERCRR
ncbi:hypothetical protein BDL97_05G086000 [Sphagnum fallax]|nr:hypothetical protein BDL97_05G086000 [Sphagnum fallax]